MEQRVLYLPESTRNLVPGPTRYSMYEEVITNKYLRWAMNKAFALMLKKGYVVKRNEYEDKIAVKKVILDMDKLDEQIVMQHNAVQMIYGNRVSAIICGHDVIAKVIQGDASSMGMYRTHMTGTSNYARTLNGYTGKSERVTYHGLEVILVPWFEGFLLIPNEESQYL